MRSLRIVLTILFLSVLPVFAQPVHIPDPSLNAIIRETIDLPDHSYHLRYIQFNS